MAAPDSLRFAAAVLHQLAAFACFEAGAFIDVTGPDAGLPDVNLSIAPRLIAQASRGVPLTLAALPPLLLAHARVLPHLLVTEGDWHACCLRGSSGRRAVVVLRAREALCEVQRQALDAFVRQLAPAFGGSRFEQEPAMLARLADGHPGMLLRVASDGGVLFCNEASQPLMAHWQVRAGGHLPPPWPDRLHAIDAAGYRLDTDLTFDGRHIELAITPSPAQGGLDLFGREATAGSEVLAGLQRCVGGPTVAPAGALPVPPGFEAGFEPRFDLASGRLMALKMLTRLRLVDAPGKTCGAGEADAAALQGALDDLRRWRTMPRDAAGHPGLTLAMDLPEEALLTPGIAARVIGALADAGLPGSSLELGLPRSVLDGSEAVLARLQALHGAGIVLALDGDCSSIVSLAALRRLPPCRLTLAGGWVGGLPARASARAVVEAQLSLSRCLGLALPVAEGVVTREQAESLQRLGCAAGQGVALSPPLTRSALEAGLARGSLSFDKETP